MRASLWAVATIAFGAPCLARMRREQPPRALSLECKLWAASRKAVAARLVVFFVPVRRVFPPEMSW